MHITGAVLAHNACVILLVREPLVDEHGCVGRASVQDNAVLGMGVRVGSAMEVGSEAMPFGSPSSVPCPTPWQGWNLQNKVLGLGWQGQPQRHSLVGERMGAGKGRWPGASSLLTAGTFLARAS